MITALFEHRSVRKYNNEPVTKEHLDLILQAASRASTTGNMQVYSIIVTQDPEIKAQLWPAHFKQDMVQQAPVILTFVADFNRFNLWCEQRNAVPGYDNFLSFYTASIDALLAAQNAVLQAEDLGYGICYLGTTTYMAQSIIDTLKLPKGVVPVTTVVIGKAAQTPDLTDRLPMDGIVHYETYQNYSPDDIDRIYAEKEQSALTQQLLIENQKETLAQIFTEKRYTQKDNVAFSQSLLEVLKLQGFMEQ